MSLTENEIHTRQLYDEKAEEWLKFSGGRDRKFYWQKEFDDFWWNLPIEGKILEIGCGPATDGKYMKEALLRSVSFDYSRSMLKIARELNPSSDLIEMDMYKMGLPSNHFDGFWAAASILHLENPERALKEIHRVTKNGGTGFISVKEGEGEGIDSRTGYYFKYYSLESFTKILQKSGFEILKDAKREGTPSHAWLTYIVRLSK